MTCIIWTLTNLFINIECKVLPLQQHFHLGPLSLASCVLLYLLSLVSTIQCEACQLDKHHLSSLSNHSHDCQSKSFFIFFILVHMNIWGQGLGALIDCYETPIQWSIHYTPFSNPWKHSHLLRKIYVPVSKRKLTTSWILKIRNLRDCFYQKQRYINYQKKVQEKNEKSS